MWGDFYLFVFKKVASWFIANKNFNYSQRGKYSYLMSLLQDKICIEIKKVNKFEVDVSCTLKRNKRHGKDVEMRTIN